MAKLVKLTEGFPLTEKHIKAKMGPMCPICATTRALLRTPRDPARRRHTEPGDLIYVNLWGPYPFQGYGDTRYYLFQVDDATLFTWATPLQSRKQLGQKLRECHDPIEKAHKITTRKYRSDNEVRKNGSFKQWTTKLGIDVEPAVPHAHWQNGAVERSHRTV